MSKQISPLVPRDGKTLVVAAVAGSAEVGPLSSVEEQFHEVHSFVTGIYPDPIEWIELSCPRSGDLNAEEFQRLTNLIMSGRLDVVICTSLGRIGRWRPARFVLELCEDHSVRVIAVNESFDTLRHEALHEFFDAIDDQLEGLRRLFRRVDRPA